MISDKAVEDEADGIVRHSSVVLWTAGGLFVAVLTCVLVVSVLLLVAWPSRSRVSVNAPAEVRTQKPFSMQILIVNESTTQPIVCTGMEIEDSLVGGGDRLSLVSCEQTIVASDYYTGTNVYLFEPVSIAQHGETCISITLVSRRAGTYEGGVGVLLRNSLGIGVPSLRENVTITAR